MGQTSNPIHLHDPKIIPEKLIRKANEVQGFIEDIPCLTLVDTGSQVSTIGRGFYDAHLSHLPLHSCYDLIRVEGASGDAIPYHGYVFVSLRLEGVCDTEVPALVVSNTAYNCKVPLLVGTNFLTNIESDPSTSLPLTVRLARQSIQLVQRHLEKSDGVYGSIYASEDVTVAKGQVKGVFGNIRITVPVADSIAMTSPAKNDSGFDITPCIVNVNSHLKTVYVEVINTSESQLNVKKGDCIAELHQVSLVGSATQVPSDDSFLKCFDFHPLEANASEEEVKKVKRMILNWQNIFSCDNADIGKTSVLKHRIDLHDETPVKERARRISPHLLEELRQHIQQLHSMGVIEESVSPWSSPIVVVRKASGEIRMCVDYRKLNAKTIKDSYRIPTIEELIDMLGGAQWFGTLDLSSGYYQVEVEEAHRERTAFTAGPLGFWQYTRMPFGLTNAPASFQRLMERVFQGVHLKTSLVYLDDIVVFGKSVEELTTRLEDVFLKIQAAGLKLKGKKCVLFHQELKYLGHIVSKEGVSCDPEMLAPVKEWKVPANVKELQRFLGFANFFRRFIKGFANIAQPLSSLLGGPKKRRKGRKVISDEEVPWVWKEEHKVAFDELKEALLSSPVLVYPDFSKPFIVRTDASTFGLGAVLCQDLGDKAGPQVIAYASRSLKPSEKNYSPYKLEFLAMY